MMDHRPQQIWLWVAAIAIMAALVLMLLPQAHSGNAAIWLAILPVVFIGLITPQAFFASLATRDSVRILDAPALQANFQRPPPFRIK